MQIPERTNLKKEFGRVVRRFRYKLGDTIEELSEKADIHPTYLSSIERGKRSPGIEIIVKLAEALEISPKELMPK